MSVENCKVLIKAKELAVERGLDSNKVICGGCVDGSDCVYLKDQDGVLMEDKFQDIGEKGIEGRTNVEKFYTNIRRHFQKVGRH